MRQTWGAEVLGRSVDELDTPALLIDLDRLNANIEEMAGFARRHGVALRPHVKTHKSPDIARLQVESGAAGVTVAKLGEAEVMAAAGLTDIFIAFPIVGAPKVRRLLALTERARVSSIVDDLGAARVLSDAFEAAGRRFPVRIKIDVGLGRCGLRPGEGVVDFARELLRLPGLELEGITTHAGHAYGARTGEELQRIGRAEGEIMVDQAERLRRAGIPVPVVSVGSTPTALISGAVEGVTEIRPGNYVFYDLMQVALGVVPVERCALSIRARVVSRPAPGRALLDGGIKTLGLDVGGHGHDVLTGYGRIRGMEDLVISRLSEEHAFVDIPDGAAGPAVGDLVDIIPNHACVVSNNFHEFLVVRDGRVEAVWPVAAQGYLR